MSGGPGPDPRGPHLPNGTWPYSRPGGRGCLFHATHPPQRTSPISIVAARDPIADGAPVEARKRRGASCASSSPISSLRCRMRRPMARSAITVARTSSTCSGTTRNRRQRRTRACDPSPSRRTLRSVDLDHPFTVLDEVRGQPTALPAGTSNGPDPERGDKSPRRQLHLRSGQSRWGHSRSGKRSLPNHAPGTAQGWLICSQYEIIMPSPKEHGHGERNCPQH